MSIKKYLSELTEKHDPNPAGKELVTSMINAGEISVAVEIIAENFYEHDVALTIDEQSALKTIAVRLNLSQDYLEMIDGLPLIHQ